MTEPAPELPAHQRGYPHAFPRLELPEPPRWVAWNLGAAADRLEELKHVVKLVRPLRGDKHLPAPIEDVLAYVAAGRYAELGPLDRLRAVDELGDHVERAPGAGPALADALWALAREDEALRAHLFRRLGNHLVGTGPIAPVLADAFPAFAARPPAGCEEVCLMLEGLRELHARGAGAASLEAEIMRAFLLEALDLS